MAELPDLGKNCSVDSCNRLDFLPLCCEHCKKTFCKDHHSISGHSCPEYQDNHSVLVNGKVDKNWKCSVSDCKEGGGVGTVHHKCLSCGAPICLKHRHENPRSHSCSTVIYASLTKDQVIAKESEHEKQCRDAFNAVEQEINGKLQTALHGRKKDMANQLRLMRLKSRAVGDPSVGIPVSCRAYFAVIPPNATQDDQRLPLAIYISKSWSLGKSIDSLEKIFKLNSRSDQKLKISMQVNQSVVFNDMSKSIASLLESGQLIEGETLLLEYKNTLA